MQKTAQKRNMKDWLSEKTNISGIAAEKFFNPEFEQVMNSLRQSDDKVRAIASGQEINGEDPGTDAISLKDLLKGAKSNINRREYMSAVADLGRFHNKMFEIVSLFKKLDLNVDKVHHQFLFKDLGDQQRQQLVDLHKKFAAQHEAAFIKEAGIMDFFHNIGTKRGRSLAAWEKRYPKQVSKLKKETANLLSASEKIFTTLIGSLKEMSSARNARHVDNYVKATGRVKSIFDSYDAGFKTYYQDNIKNFLMQTDFLPKEETAPAVKVEDAKEIGTQEVAPAPSATTTVNAPPSEEVLQTTQHSNTIPSPPPANMSEGPPPMEGSVYEQIMTPGSLKPQPVPSAPPALPPTPEVESEPATGRAAIMPPPLAHRNFYNTLESLSGEDPLVLAGFIRKYAQKIQNSDPETSINLFKIARSIKV